MSSFHTFQDLFSEHRNLSSAQWLEQVQSLLDRGVDPNAPNEHENTPLGVLADFGIGNDGAYHRGVELLIEHGANPLIHDRALARAATQVAIGPDAGLFGTMMAALIRLEEAGNPMRSESGETPLHAVCTDAPQIVWQMFDQSGRLAMGQARVPQSWITSVDDNGYTPLHAMWAPYGAIYDRLDGGMDVDDFLAAWEGAQALIEQGADVAVLDKNGRSPAYWASKCVKMGMEPDEQAWPALEAQAQSEKLNKRTPRGRSPGSTKRL